MNQSQTENIQHPAYLCRYVLNPMAIYDEYNLKSVIYRHKLFMIKEQFGVALAPSNQRSENSLHSRFKGA